MTTQQELERRPEDNVRRTEAPATDTVYLPVVDVWETSGEVRLMAELPGVDDRSVQVTVENGVLTIEGRTQVDKPEGHELIASEFALGRFRRDFTLSDEVNPEGIKARVRQGVLDLAIPRKEAAKARKIEVST
jgi:HSP20 family molecular chaperone IbpA